MTLILKPKPLELFKILSTYFRPSETESLESDSLAPDRELSSVCDTTPNETFHVPQ
jgi:hypothetical protein